MVMRKFIATRVLGFIIIVWVMLTVVFYVTRTIPSDPTILYVTSQMSSQEEEDLIQRFALDESLGTQYIQYLKNFFQGDLGDSFFYGEPVWTLLKNGTIPTLILLAGALSWALVMDFLSDRIYPQKALINSIAYLIPFLFLGLLLIFVFSFKMDMVPLGGWMSESVRTGSAGAQVGDVLHHMILPVMVLIIWLLVAYIPLVKTLSRGVITEKKSLIPPGLSIAIAGFFLYYSLQIVMTVFSWPGYHGMMLNASLFYDYPLAFGALLVSLLFSFAVTLCLEIVYGALAFGSHPPPTASPS
jgi:peptide/nickel transport system permease protein